MSAAELEQFLNHLAVNKNVSGFDAKPGPERPDIVLSVREAASDNSPAPTTRGRDD